MSSHPTLFPPPRHIQLDREHGDGRELAAVHDPTMPPQGYRLTIGPEGTTIEHADAAGLAYARDTLRQLRRAEPVRCGVVEDWPAMPSRTYMLDISRDRVPTLETLGWLIGILGRLRYNELQLYTEHTFAWPGHEIVWRDASPLTADDLTWLADACDRAGIELVPCLNGFGHMERFLRHEPYRHRAECPDGAPALTGSGLRPPTTLAPTEDNAAFSVALFREYLDALPARRIHIGGDEPFELGRGVSAAAVAARGRSAVYLEHLRRLMDPLLGETEVLFWGDVLRDAPAHVAALPRDGATAVAWHYEGPRPDAPPLSSVLGPELVAALGMPEDGMTGFAAHTRTFVETGFPFRVAAGTSTWNSLIGRWPNAAANITDAVLTGLAGGATGFQLTDWGDNGHHHPLAISLPPLVHAAETAWAGTERTRVDVAAEIDRLLEVPGLGSHLVSLGSVHDRLGARAFNSSPLCDALFGPVRVRPDRVADLDTVHDLIDLIDRTAAFADCADPLGPELAAVCALARLGVERVSAAAGRPTRPARDIEADLPAAISAQRAAWLRSSRPGGLADSLGRIR